MTLINSTVFTDNAQSLKKYYKCNRCSGKGYIRAYLHVQNGVCFSCWGNGVKPIPNNIIDEKCTNENWYHCIALCQGEERVVLRFKANDLVEAKLKQKIISKRKKNEYLYKHVDWNSLSIHQGDAIKTLGLSTVNSTSN